MNQDRINIVIIPTLNEKGWAIPTVDEGISHVLCGKVNDIVYFIVRY
jgi:hypothetical protein